MSPINQRLQYIKSQPTVNTTSTFPCLRAVILSTMCISTAKALSLNPSNRYRKEMRRLLRDNQKLNVVASPEKAQTETDMFWDDDDNDDDDDDYDSQYYNEDILNNNNSQEREMMEQAWREQKLGHEMDQAKAHLDDEPSWYGPAFNTFDDEQVHTDFPPQDVQQGFDRPRPPSNLPPTPPSQDGMFMHQHQQQQQFQIDYTNDSEPQIINNGQRNEPNDNHHYQPQQNKDLFQAFNHHIEAIGQQLQQKSNSLRDAIDENFPHQQPEVSDETEWVYDDDIEQDGYYFEVDKQEEYPSIEQSEFFEAAIHAPNNEDFYAESVQGDFTYNAASSVSQSAEVSDSEVTEQQFQGYDTVAAEPQPPAEEIYLNGATEHFQSYDTTYVAVPQPSPQQLIPQQNNRFDAQEEMRQELERLTVAAEPQPPAEEISLNSATEHFQSYDTTFVALPQPSPQQLIPRQDNRFDAQEEMRQELERLQAEKKAAEEKTDKLVAQEREKERVQHKRLEQERLVSEQAKSDVNKAKEITKRAVQKQGEQAVAKSKAELNREITRRAIDMREKQREAKLEKKRLIEAQAKADRSERLRREKEDIQQEMARQIAELYRREVDARTKEPTSIIKSKYQVSRLPRTNDPLELLGLDYRNPPESADELRRAYLKMAKKYHPDKVAKDASPDESEIASLNFAKINSAYQLLKDKQEWLGDEYFAEMLGGPMYQPRDSRKSHIRQPFSRSGSSFSNSYSATYGAQQRGGADAGSGYYGESRSFFQRAQRAEIRNGCHVTGGKDFPPFFNH